MKKIQLVEWEEVSTTGRVADTVTPMPSTLQVSEPLQRTEYAGWQPWLHACGQVLPIYMITHVIFVLLTYLASLFSLKNFSYDTLSVSSLLQAWNRWDSGHFLAIAQHGYDEPFRTAFFPLYPLLVGALTYVVREPLLAGLLVSNVATFVLFVVLYRLIEGDFTSDLAQRVVLYMAVFPTAFFLVAAYNESLFLVLTLCSFYHMRRGNWWLSGGLGFLAALTRSSGLLLLVPFCYEYARQHGFKVRALLHINVVSLLCIPAGVAVFAFYCALRFGDALAFSHAQRFWGRELQWPWQTLRMAIGVIRTNSLLSFNSIHTVIDLGIALVMLVLILLSIFGPWRLGRDKWSYSIYAVVFYLFLISFPARNVPVQSLARQCIELFPAFVLLATLGRKADVHLSYLLISLSVMAFLLLQFLTGYWIV